MAVYPAQNGVIAQNGELPIRLLNGLLYPRVEEEQRTHSGDEIGVSVVNQREEKTKEPCKNVEIYVRWIVHLLHLLAKSLFRGLSVLKEYTDFCQGLFQ